MGKKRGFKASQNKGQKFQARTSRQESPEQQPPYFSLRYMNNDFCLSLCETKEKAAFADTLYRLSQLPWAQLKQQNRHGLGYEIIARHSIKSGIPSHIKDDVNFIAFRFHGKKAMVGYRDGHIFHVIWLDRAFKLYKHQ
ncbi:MAG TPA: hypothetical protein C5S50_00420 [Methanosarcinaceae archaeon]|nr:hypothetical protein [Methanosarcinaceae archaeon]